MPNPEVIALTREELPTLAKQVTDNLAPLGFPRTARQNLEDFLNTLHEAQKEQSVSTIALVSVPNEIPGPRLDFWALLEHPEVLDRDTVYIEQVVSNHTSKFAIPLGKIIPYEQYYGTFIQVVDPRGYPSAESLRDSLVKKYGAGFSAGVIAVANLVKS